MAARIREGLTQKEVADKMGMTQPAVANWEACKTSPNTVVRTRLDKWLGIASGKWKKELDGSGIVEVPTSVEPSPIGVWLRKLREKADLTVAELAEHAKVSVPAIYNIESGRIRNPQKKTITRLEQALGGRLPLDAEESVAEEQGVEGLGPLTDFDPHSKPDLLPTCSGVYVLYDVSDRPIYVGQSKKISGRINDHKDKFWYRPPIVENGAYIEVNDETLRRRIEQILIRFLKSNAVINQQNVDRD